MDESYVSDQSGRPCARLRALWSAWTVGVRISLGALKKALANAGRCATALVAPPTGAAVGESPRQPGRSGTTTWSATDSIRVARSGPPGAGPQRSGCNTDTRCIGGVHRLMRLSVGHGGRFGQVAVPAKHPTVVTLLGDLRSAGFHGLRTPPPKAVRDRSGAPLCWIPTLPPCPLPAGAVYLERVPAGGWVFKLTGRAAACTLRGGGYQSRQGTYCMSSTVPLITGTAGDVA